MNWDEDIDLLVNKKGVPKQGRRSSGVFGIDNPEDTLEQANSSKDTIEVPLRTRKTGVWTDDGAKSAKNKSSTNIIEMERFQNKEKVDEDDDIPVIPDIDDLQDDPLNLPDVKPIVSVDKSTYNELNSNLGNIQGEQMNFGNLGNIDLSFLTNKLYPEKDVQSKNEIWTMESLFNDLSRNSS